MTTEQYDLAIVGSGFGGSLLAMVARRIGLSVLLLEKGRHPRFAIGESTSPLTNLLIEELALRYDLPRLLPLTSFGPWQRIYPQIGCGLKRGFTYYHHTAGNQREPDPNRRKELLVAASPNDEVSDTHWLRSDVDTFLMQEAVTAGAEYWDQTEVNPPVRNADGTYTLHGQTGPAQTPFAARVRLIVDATGPRGYLSRTLSLPASEFPNYPATQALFTHFSGVHRCETMPAYTTLGETPPYAPDDAALHHVFDGGWMWVLRFGNGITSAGVAVTDALAAEVGLFEGAPAWERLLARYPAVGEQFAKADPLFPFIYTPRLPYRATVATGPGWVLLPSAAAFIDPLFSTGIPLTLLGIQRLSRLLETQWGQPDFDAHLAQYAETTLAEVDATADFISGCYAAMGRFRLFTALSMFYFAAASFSEMARRLDQRHLVRRFLATDHLQFGPALHKCAEWVRQNGRMATHQEVAAFERRVAEGIACLNIAGLCDPQKRNWYGVDLGDVVRSAHKLGKESAEIESIIKTASWATASPDTPLLLN